MGTHETAHQVREAVRVVRYRGLDVVLVSKEVHELVPFLANLDFPPQLEGVRHLHQVISHRLALSFVDAASGRLSKPIDMEVEGLDAEDPLEELDLVLID